MSTAPTTIAPEPPEQDPTSPEALRLLPVFITVAEVGRVTPAAAVLEMPQPTVSRALARLGELLGTPVVQRDGPGITLTAAGRALLPFAQDGVAALERGGESSPARPSSGTAR